MADKEEKKAEKEVKNAYENIKEETGKVVEDIKEGAKKVYSSNDDLGEKIVDFMKNNVGLLLGLLVGIILVATGAAKLLMNIVVIIVSAIVGYYVQSKMGKKE